MVLEEVVATVVALPEFPDTLVWSPELVPEVFPRRVISASVTYRLLVESATSAVVAEVVSPFVIPYPESVVGAPEILPQASAVSQDGLEYEPVV